MESKNQIGEQVDYDNLEQYTKKELLNICTDLNLTVNKSFLKIKGWQFDICIMMTVMVGLVLKL